MCVCVCVCVCACVCVCVYTHVYIFSIFSPRFLSSPLFLNSICLSILQNSHIYKSRLHSFHIVQRLKSLESTVAAMATRCLHLPAITTFRNEITSWQYSFFSKLLHLFSISSWYFLFLLSPLLASFTPMFFVFVFFSFSLYVLFVLFFFFCFVLFFVFCFHL